METAPEQVVLSRERARWCRLPPGQEPNDDDNAGADRRPAAPAASVAAVGAAAGTGVVISSNGLVLTNNHVIADTAQLRVENSADGSMHSAKVLGYSVTADVALIKIEGVSGLTAAPIGNSSNLSIGDAV